MLLMAGFSVALVVTTALASGDRAIAPNDGWHTDSLTSTSDVDMWHVTTTCSGTLDWQVSSISGGPQLRVLGYHNAGQTSGSPMTEALIPSGTGENFGQYYPQPCPAGTYYLSVNSTSSNGFYKVRVVVTCQSSPPQASITSAPTIYHDNVYYFSIKYTDDTAILTSTIGNGDVLVTGPNGYNEVATYYAKTPSSGDASSIVVIYTIPAPGGNWDFSDNGIYSISIVASQVSDTENAFVPAGLSGTFQVELLNCVYWGYAAGDLNKDCYVDFEDFALFVETWLTCTDPHDSINCTNFNQ